MTFATHSLGNAAAAFKSMFNSNFPTLSNQVLNGFYCGKFYAFCICCSVIIDDVDQWFSKWAISPPWEQWGGGQ